MPNALKVLIVEDSENDTLLITRELQRGGFEVDFERVDTPESLRGALAKQSWDLIISDYSMPRFRGPEALAIYNEHEIDIPFISVSGTMGEDTAVAMVKAGAHDYVMKNQLDRLAPAVTRELRAAQERRVCRHTEAVAKYLASIVEYCDDAIVGCTLDGTIVSWNRGAERLYGYSAVEMIGRSISVLLPSYRPQELPEFLERIRQGGRVGWLDTIRIRKNGTPVEVSLAISPIKDADGNTIGASEAGRDITRRKQEENERLRLIQDLTEALAGSGVADGAAMSRG
jgi:PAS domain S-box-containing protein